MARQPNRPAYDRRIQTGIGYARDVVAGRVLAARWTRLACKRFLDDLKAAETGQGPWAFDERFAIRPIELAGHLQNVKGPEAGQPIQLMPWQLWLLANLFGFIERDTGIRRFRQASVWVPKSAGKTTIAAVLALNCTFLEEEGGAEGYSAAVSREQARIVFDLAKEMTQRDRAFRQHFGIDVQMHALRQQRSASRFMPISSDAKALDGINVHFAVLDEIASHRSKAVYDVIITAMGKRRQPLLLTISTATDNTTGVGRQVWNYTEQVLDGALKDDRFFGVIYAADADDDPWDEATWIKANPGWGQTVQPDALRAVARQALASPALKAAFMTRHLNVWASTENALFDRTAWDACADPDLSINNLRGQPCYAALDMAARTDLAAAVLLFPYDVDGETHYKLFAKAWLPQAAVNADRNPLYVQWAEQEALTVTEGETTDFSAVENWVRRIAAAFDLRACAYDPYMLMQMSQRLQNDGYPVKEYRATTLNFSEPTKLLDALMRERRIAHDGDPVLAWCIGNVVGHYDARSNVYPRREDPSRKIDCAVATIMALGVSISDEAQSDYIYRDHGLLVF